MDPKIKNLIITILGFILSAIAIFYNLTKSSSGFYLFLLTLGMFLFIMGIVNLFRVQRFLLGSLFIITTLVIILGLLVFYIKEESLNNSAVAVIIFLPAGIGVIIAGILMLFRESDRKHFRENFLKNLIKIGIVPRFKEIDVFLITITLLALLIGDSVFRSEFFGFFLKEGEGESIILFASFLFSMGLSIYYVFINKKIGRKHKEFLYYFAIYINFFAGLFSGQYLLKHQKGFLMVFPLFNILSGIFLITLVRLRIFEEHIEILFEGAQSQKGEVILGIIFTLLIFLLSHFILKHYWAITFSMCLFYVTNLNEILKKIFKISKGPEIKNINLNNEIKNKLYN